MALIRTLSLLLILSLGWTQTYAMVCETACVKSEYLESLPDCHKTEADKDQECNAGVLYGTECSAKP